MTVPTTPTDEDVPLLPIGRAAQLADVSERTLHYYEQIGLLTPAEHDPGRHRRYNQANLERLTHIRELQDVMGYSLDEIGAILATEDRMDTIRAAWRGQHDPREQHRLLDEALAEVEGQRRRVHAKVERLEGILARLDAKAGRYRQVLAQLEDAAPEARTGPDAPAPGGE